MISCLEYPSRQGFARTRSGRIATAFPRTDACYDSRLSAQQKADCRRMVDLCRAGVRCSLGDICQDIGSQRRYGSTSPIGHACHHMRSSHADTACLQRGRTLYAEIRIHSDDSTACGCARHIWGPLPPRLRQPSFTNQGTSFVRLRIRPRRHSPLDTASVYCRSP